MPRVYKRVNRRGIGYARKRALSRRSAARTALVVSRRTRIPRPRLTLAGQPKSKVVKMRYADQIALNAGIGAAAFYTFRAGSIFDPDYTGTGHQPMGHDQWAQFYNHYVVLGAKITVTFSNEDAGDPMIAGVLLNDDTSLTSATVTSIIENGKGAYCHLDTGGGPGIRRISQKYSAKKFFKCDVKDRTDLKATFGTNPTEDAYFVVWTAAMNTGSDPSVVYATVKIDYIVLMSEPKDFGPS